MHLPDQDQLLLQPDLGGGGLYGKRNLKQVSNCESSN